MRPTCLLIECALIVLQVDMEKVNMDVIKPWITKKLIEILGFEDDVVMQYVFNMLESEKVNKFAFDEACPL